LFKKVLIANRGEIAIRIINALKELDIKSVAIYSEADKDSLHVQLADEAICIGPPHPLQSYLNITSILSAAEVSGAEAIHPGYGFLAENPKFAEICEECGLVFIGPKASMMEKLGDKISARKIASQASVPILQGTIDPISDLNEAIKIAKKIKFPVILKAAAGGGGRGMRIVTSEDDFENVFLSASSEAEKAFGDGRLYLEKYLEEPRHIEIQVLADNHKNIICFPERDCSIQRRHQKLIEESPSPAVSPSLRKKIQEAAEKLIKKAGYVGAGTVEFLLDEEGNFYFMEVNTRIQVEHPVTEIVSGVDLVKAQILIAQGENISYLRKKTNFGSHCIEFRINAEDPQKFIPSVGKIETLRIPCGIGVRLDTHIYQGYNIPPFYDSLLAKLIIWGENRKEAIKRAKRALSGFVIEGVKTTIPLYLKILDDEAFINGAFSTRYLERHTFF
jgi:acetyl-CoA carboxylase biotin carboxylase subunit